MKNYRIVILFYVTLCIASGCKSNSTGPTSSTPLIPKVGSIFIFQNTQVDTNGATTSVDTSVQTILQENVTLGIYHDVVLVQEIYWDGTPTDSIYYRYVTGGDLMLGISDGSGPTGAEWITLPFGSHAQQNTTAWDMEKYVKDEDVVVKGKTLSCSVVSLSTISHSGSTVIGNALTDIDFSPTIGYVTFSNDVSNIYQGARGNLGRSWLIDYTLK